MNTPHRENIISLNHLQRYGLGLIILSALFVISRYNFLLFHGLAELYSIAVAWSVFFLIWNSRRIVRNDALVFLGIAYLFIGLIDSVHTFSFKGMGVFPDFSEANYSTQLWITARALESISLLLFSLLYNRRIRPLIVFAVYGTITVLAMAAIFSWQVFPVCFIEGTGLTLFKKTAEYIICLILAGAIALLFRIRNQLDRVVFKLMIMAMGVTIAGELCFTFYVSVDGFLIVVGHFLKIISFYFIYMALVRSSLTNPYTTLFQRLVKEKAALEESHESSRKKIQAILTPKGDIETLNLEDIIDREAIQSLLEDFFKITNVLSAVLDLSGNILVAVGWQDICTKFHRCHGETSKNCLESDTVLTHGIPLGTFKAYRCKNNLWDMATPIEIGGRHMGNIFIGQFFYDDETPDYDLFRQQARQYGFDEAEYLAALDRVPRLSRETVNRAMAFFTKLSGMISTLSYSNVSLARMNSQQETSLARLEERDQYISSILETTQEGFWVLDNQGKLIDVNEAYCLLSGYSRQELLQLYIKDLEANEKPEEIAARIKRIIKKGSERFETCHRRKDGRIFNVEVSVSWQAGNTQRFICFCHDISERKVAEEALKESEDRLRKAQEAAKIGNWEYDISTGQIWGSKEAFRIYGLERKTPFLPLNEVEDCIIEAERVNKSLIDLITKNVPYNIEFELKPVNREGLILVHSLAELVCDNMNKPVKVTGVIQDITEAKTKEKEQLKLRVQLEQAQKMESVGRLAGGVAHDFNNMLGVILGHTEMLLDQTSQDEPIHASLEEIKKAGERSADLTRQLLAFARRQTVSPKLFDLNQAVEGMLNMLRRLIGEDITLFWLPAKDLMMVHIDPSQIDQMLANLCVNGRDAITGIGKITIETDSAVFDEAYCSVHSGTVPGEFVLLAVSDNGCGMAQETLSNVFEPFYTTKEQGKGTGLGLATIYGIVKQNNGFINVYSEPGLGTTFRIYLPRHRDKTSIRIMTEENKPDVRGQETILLVEDELSILKMTTVMLERLGYTVVAAGSPGEAIRLAGEHAGPIHLLMTDVIMPEMNGRDLAKSILTLYPNINRLFMSGYTADVIAHHGVLNKGVNFIQKPFSIKDLAAKVREALDNSEE